MNDVINDIIFWFVMGIIVNIIIDYILFRIWHYYAHYDRYVDSRQTKHRIKKSKDERLKKELHKRGFNNLEEKNNE